MRITFNIDYRTNWGESLYICGDIPELGGGDQQKALPMRLVGAENWSIDVEISAKTKDFNYYYIVKPENAAWRFEWGAPHQYRIGKGVKLSVVNDRWQDMPKDKPYYSSAFVNGMLYRSCKDQALSAEKGVLNIRVAAPMIQPDEILALAGEGDALGNWDVKQAIRMNDANFPEWEANIDINLLKDAFEYKFVILKKDTSEVVAWEMCNNRRLELAPYKGYEYVVVSGMRFVNPLQPWKCAGTAIPTFSVRTEEDFGVGDFIDLKKMVDWCKMTGQKVLQLLPINDTTMTGTWTDSYPYNANSTFALHPMYIRLSAVGKLKNKERQEYYDNLGRELNQLADVDYERVNNGKKEFLREIFVEKAASVQREKAYKTFVSENEYWLKPYAAFCLLRDMNGTPEMDKWGEYSVYNQEKVDRLCAENDKEIRFVYFVQYHLDKQLKDVRNYAHQQGVVLKGDIPIGISRTSADAWQYPHLFYMDCQAGAPPDDFSILGQNWGFPTYNWEEMAKDGFAWWKARFRKMAEYFDAYRIDHVLGFFRIWQIPMNAVHGLLGTFNPAMPYSVEELRNNYDFWINPEVQARPFIMEWLLTDFFGEFTAEAKERFLNDLGYGRYELKEFVDTQKKVVEYFAKEEKNDKNDRLENALLGLLDDVLFIEDATEKGKFHPRISGQHTYSYRALSEYEKWCYDRLYNDFFYRRHNEFWYGKAMWKLPPLLDSNSMLTCAEDLGMIPDCVPAVMDELQILALEIQRMPKDPKVEFGNTWSYPYYSVCTTSTHDMPGIRAWWESDKAMSQRFYNNVLHEGGEAPYFAEPWICSKILDLHLNSPAMLCVLPLQDWLSIDGSLRRKNPNEELINIPAISRHYWKYRMHITVEQLMSETSFNDSLINMINHSGR